MIRLLNLCNGGIPADTEHFVRRPSLRVAFSRRASLALLLTIGLAPLLLLLIVPLSPSPRICFGLGPGILGLDRLPELNLCLFDIIGCGVTRLIKVAGSIVFGSCSLRILLCGLC